MSFLKLNSAAGAMMAALVILSAGSQAAMAKMLYLKCGETVLTVDLANNTVDNHPATINATAIDWQIPQSFTTPKGAESTVSYDHIDRSTGIMSSYFILQFPGGSNRSGTTTYNCVKSSAPATKF